jgi:hypothetical protein
MRNSRGGSDNLANSRRLKFEQIGRELDIDQLVLLKNVFEERRTARQPSLSCFDPLLSPSSRLISIANYFMAFAERGVHCAAKLKSRRYLVLQRLQIAAPDTAHLMQVESRERHWRQFASQLLSYQG